MAFIYVAQRGVHARLDAEDGGGGLRAAAVPGADGRAPQGHDRPRRADVRQGAGQRRRGRRPRPRQRVVPHRRAGEEDRRGELPGRARRPTSSPPSSSATGRGCRRWNWPSRSTAGPATATAATRASTSTRCRGANATTPVPPEVNPRQVFDRLFADKPQRPGGGRPERAAGERARLRPRGRQGPEPQARRQRPAEARPVPVGRAGAGEADRPRRAADARPSLPDDVSRPAGVPADLTEHIRLMCDLMVLAFQTDSTRIGAFMLGREGSEQKYRMVGVNEGHHRSRTTRTGRRTWTSSRRSTPTT